MGAVVLLAALNGGPKPVERASAAKKKELSVDGAQARRDTESSSVAKNAGPRTRTLPSDQVITSNSRVVLLPISGGTFIMGSPASEEGRLESEGPQHTVTISPFLLGKFEVTNEEYGRFLKANPDAPKPQFWSDGRYNQSRQPVIGVSWAEANRFAQWAGALLPTEAEWEYACRAGTSGNRYGKLSDVAWYSEHGEGVTHAVGEKQANAFGLYDMLGNAWEWCGDGYAAYGARATIDPHGPGVSFLAGLLWRGRWQRVIRGGAWSSDAANVRAAMREGYSPEDRFDDLGFRIARGQSPTEPARPIAAPVAEPLAQPAALGSQPRYASPIETRKKNLALASRAASPPSGAPQNRYEISSLATVYDTTTNLTWQRGVPAEDSTQPNAVGYCQRLKLAGGGWRLPTRDELFSIVNKKYKPSIDPTAFPNTPPDWFWSSSEHAGTTGDAWYVGFSSGDSDYGSGASTTNRIRCVR